MFKDLKMFLVANITLER